MYRDVELLLLAITTSSLCLGLWHTAFLHVRLPFIVAITFVGYLIVIVIA